MYVRMYASVVTDPRTYISMYVCPVTHAQCACARRDSLASHAIQYVCMHVGMAVGEATYMYVHMSASMVMDHVHMYVHMYKYTCVSLCDCMHFCARRGAAQLCSRLA